MSIDTTHPTTQPPSVPMPICGPTDSMVDNKVILAPMVRVGTLAFRQLAINYGAQVVYTEEIIDRKLLKTERRVDTAKGLVEYVLTEQRGKLLKETVVFSTLLHRPTNREGVPVILQLGTGDPDHALAAARHVEADVDGIDVNMGCPKKFSVQGGMGSALLREPERIRRILTALVEGLRKPVSCKIRILEDRQATLALLRVILSTGVKAIGIHPRVPNARTEAVPADYAQLKGILEELGPMPIPTILSGDVGGREHFDAARRATGVRSVMIARAAMWNASCFSVTRVPKVEYAQALMWYSLYYNNSFEFTKYTLTRSFQDDVKRWMAIHNRLQAAKTMDDLCMALGMAPRAEYAEVPPPAGSLQGKIQQLEEAAPGAVGQGLVTPTNEGTGVDGGGTAAAPLGVRVQNVCARDDVVVEKPLARALAVPSPVDSQQEQPALKKCKVGEE